MDYLLQRKQKVQTEHSRSACIVEEFMDEGGQGQVFLAKLSGTSVVVKWYFPEILKYDPDLRKRLQVAIQRGSPTSSFVWPFDLATVSGRNDFGYVMPLLDTSRFRTCAPLLEREIDPSFMIIAAIGFNLAHNLLFLHAEGLCYIDLSFGNFRCDFDTGEIAILDNDNVTPNGTASIIAGTPFFRAPEILRSQTNPNVQTDLFSLSVILFYLFVNSHPLRGRRVLNLAFHKDDREGEFRLHGFSPLFIYDPADHSNEPVPGEHENALALWPILPLFVRELFTRAFTVGLHEPYERITESEWRDAMCQLRDHVFLCPHCSAENFYDPDLLQKTRRLNPCWSCHTQLQPPSRIRIGKQVVMLTPDTRLYPHHLDGGEKKYDFSKPLAEITTNPSGIKNVSNRSWAARTPDGQTTNVPPGSTLILTSGTKIYFGKSEGEIKL